MTKSPLLTPFMLVLLLGACGDSDDTSKGDGGTDASVQKDGALLPDIVQHDAAQLDLTGGDAGQLDLTGGDAGQHDLTGGDDLLSDVLVDYLVDTAPADVLVDYLVDTATGDVLVDYLVDTAPADGAAQDGAAQDGAAQDAVAQDGAAQDGAAQDGAAQDGAAQDTIAADAAVSCEHPMVTPSCSGDWCTIPAGCFTMGSPPGEPGRNDVNETQHEVTLTHDFVMAKTEVTQAQFQMLMGYNPSHFTSCGMTCPVESITWHEAAAYCNALSVLDGFDTCYICSGTQGSVNCSEVPGYTGQDIYDCPGYRLPTEAEWEYAYRAGTTTAFYNGPISNTGCSFDANASQIGWYCDNAGSTTHPVGQKMANGWSLLDIAGNVYEWNNDDFQTDLGPAPVVDPVGGTSGLTKVFRSGSWYCNTENMRAARRFSYPPTDAYNYIGVRCVRSIIP